jgi:hypothetical protein
VIVIKRLKAAFTKQKDDYHTLQELKDHVKALGGHPAKTMQDLYAQRTELSIALFNRTISSNKWKFASEPGWFAYGIELPGIGPVGYHAPIKYWNQVQAAESQPIKIDNKTLERLIAYNFGNQHRDKFISLNMEDCDCD